MIKNVLFYARYSTDRQNEVSIETQVELGKEFVSSRGWNLIDVFSDAAISGSSYKTRPGIQAALRRVGRGDIDLVLCVTVDRISRDAEHGNGFLKRLRFNDTELWTVHGGIPVTDIEMALRVTLSQELIDQIRYRTREGMKTAVRKGKATTCLAYGYKLKLEYDAIGDRIPGLREIDQDKAEIIRWIFQQYAQGVSPRDIAIQLNARGVPGPRGRKWRDTAIRGHVSRGTGILNNETYIGRVVWNRRNYRKNPETERRVARSNKPDTWVTNEVPEMRIVSDELWAKVKKRQAEVEEHFNKPSANPLNDTHRPRYLLSGLLECAECGGPYAIMSKDRYGCTNRKKGLPIDELGGACCSNSKTILRADVEERVLSIVPSAFLSFGIFDKVSKAVVDKFAKKLRDTPSSALLNTQELERIDVEQKSIIKQITDRAAAGRPHLSALDDVLDQLEAKKGEVQALIAAANNGEEDYSAKLAKLQAEVTPSAVEKITHMALHILRDKIAADEKQRYIDVIRMLVQNVVIGKTPGHQPAELTVHGRIASILGAMEAATIVEQQFKYRKNAEFSEKIDAGILNTDQKQKEFLDAVTEELSIRREEWRNLQVSVVAGAGFEPAAFRL
jgi:DNA invertase Pin-like site-specific DNA recombinase